MKHLLLFATSLFFVSLGLVRAAEKAEPQTAQVAGVWEFSVETSIGSGSPEFTFKQEGERISGTYDGAFGKSPLSGTVSGSDIRYTFEVEGDDGKKAVVEYVGTVKGDTMKGTVKIGTLGEGTFTARRTKKG